MKLQSPFGSSGLERIGLEPCGLEVSKSIWLERARAKGQETWKGPDLTDQSARARSSQMDFERMVFGGGKSEKSADMGVQGALNIKDYIYILFIFKYIIILMGCPFI